MWNGMVEWNDVTNPSVMQCVQTWLASLKLYVVVILQCNIVITFSRSSVTSRSVATYLWKQLVAITGSYT